MRQRLSRVPRWGWAAPAAGALVALGAAVQSLGPGGSAAGGGSDPLLEALMAQPGGTALAAVRSERAVQRLEASTGRAAGALREPDAGPPLQLEIRVALLTAGTQPTLSATGPWQLRDAAGAVLQQGLAGEPVANALAVQHGEAWLIPARSAALLVNGKSYAGRLRLLPKDGGVQAINHLGLESYIAAVVGAEMPSSWALHALKAQAVAARSYALAHMARPANRHWHLGDTTRWQAYRGLERLNNRTLEAASGTAGIILSYQGAIVESLYAANRQITIEAHGHLGASMSQHGARELAEDGHRYNAILGRYYPGASLARLRAGGG
ncbi:MAG: SpoIID/LytB domain-containing protein [Cyanobacteriota bacterium]|nr:SpoIID/LytB domain-containing protein [Cyanobacteriota bacterium]